MTRPPVNMPRTASIQEAIAEEEAYIDSKELGVYTTAVQSTSSAARLSKARMLVGIDDSTGEPIYEPVPDPLKELL